LRCPLRRYMRHSARPHDGAADVGDDEAERPAVRRFMPLSLLNRAARTWPEHPPATPLRSAAFDAPAGTNPPLPAVAKMDDATRPPVSGALIGRCPGRAHSLRRNVG